MKMNELGFAVLITTDGDVDVIEMPYNYDKYRAAIRAPYFENVFMHNPLLRDIVMMVDEDEEGKLTGKPVNWIASALYANPYDLIVGEALILRLARVGEYNELDCLPFATKEEAEECKSIIGVLV
ncbi:MAG: DUF3846 domain-containing protein [Clostridia bacterium]|nr:DUF3846 domain-containing protein [Clostridia bacterium]